MAADTAPMAAPEGSLIGLTGATGAGKGWAAKTLAVANAQARAASGGAAAAAASDVHAYAAAVGTTDEALLVDLLTQIGVRGSWSRADLVVGALDTTSVVVSPAVGEAFRLAGYPTRISELAIARGLLATGDRGVWLTTAGHAVVNGVRQMLGWPPLLAAR